MKITIQYATDKKLAPAKTLISKWAKQALADKTDKTDVTIRIVDNSEMAMLNQTYRHKSGPTNVLSFPADLPPPAAEKFQLLGDIIICAEVVNREALEQNKESNAHWAHMVIHGIFHLLGYDHVKDEEAEEMEKCEIDIMQKLGFENPYKNGEHCNHHE